MGKSKFLAENTVMRYLFTGLLLFSGLFAQGATQDSVEQVLTNYFQELGKTPQEKLYLHLDKSYYGAGETIWFKGYLLNATTARVITYMWNWSIKAILYCIDTSTNVTQSWVFEALSRYLLHCPQEIIIFGAILRG